MPERFHKDCPPLPPLPPLRLWDLFCLAALLSGANGDQVAVNATTVMRARRQAEDLSQ